MRGIISMLLPLSKSQSNAYKPARDAETIRTQLDGALVHVALGQTFLVLLSLHPGDTQAVGRPCHRR